MKSVRKRLLIDRPVQFTIVTRIVLHWMAYLAAVMIALPLFRAIFLADPTMPAALRLQEALTDAMILGVCFLALLPYLIYDTFKTTNRFAGPMYRLHQTMKSFADGSPIHNLRFRNGDFWNDVATDFNRMVNVLKSSDAGDSSRSTASAALNDTLDADSAVETTTNLDAGCNGCEVSEENTPVGSAN